MEKTHGGRDWMAWVLTEEKSVEQIFPLRKFAGKFRQLREGCGAVPFRMKEPK
jgi:hypothetical protein